MVLDSKMKQAPATNETRSQLQPLAQVPMDSNPFAWASNEDGNLPKLLPSPQYYVHQLTPPPPNRTTVLVRQEPGT